MSPRSFDRLADHYRLLEYAAFGRDLERARFCFLPELRSCRSILILGEGDGRCLERLAPLVPQARIDCVDSSAAMLARARRRLEGTGQAARISFYHRDVFALSLPPNHYDGIVTFFFLDCFGRAEVEAIARELEPSLRPEALWLFADFVLPARGWARWRGNIWLALLYAFFRWQTGLSARSLPDSEGVLEAAGWRREKTRVFQRGLIRSSVYRRP